MELSRGADASIRLAKHELKRGAAWRRVARSRPAPARSPECQRFFGGYWSRAVSYTAPARVIPEHPTRTHAAFPRAGGWSRRRVKAPRWASSYRRYARSGGATVPDRPAARLGAVNTR